MFILIMVLLLPISIIIAVLVEYFIINNQKNDNLLNNVNSNTDTNKSSTNELEQANSNVISNLENVIKQLKDVLSTSNYILEVSEKKNTIKALNRLSQGLFRFINGKIEYYSKNDVELLFEEIEEIFYTINYKLIIPVENDEFDQNLMIIKDFELTNDVSKINKVFRTAIIGYKNIEDQNVSKKAEVIVYKQNN